MDKGIEICFRFLSKLLRETRVMKELRCSQSQPGHFLEPGSLLSLPQQPVAGLLRSSTTAQGTRVPEKEIVSELSNLEGFEC